MSLYCFHLAATISRRVKFRVEGVEVLGVQMILNDSQTFAKPLEVHHFSLAQESDGIADLRVLDQAEDVVIGGAGFLLCCNHVRTTFCQNLIGQAVFSR